MKAMKVLEELGFGDSRAWHGFYEIELFEAKIEKNKKALAEIEKACASYPDVSAMKIESLLDGFAESLENDSPGVEISPHYRPLNYDGYVINVILSGVEISRQGGKTISVSDFFEDRGRQIAQEYKVKMLSELKAWADEKRGKT